VLVGVVGPSAGDPIEMLLNAVVLLAVAVALLAAAVHLAIRAWGGRSHRARVPAALAVVALGVGSVGYLLNLLARWAVVLSGSGTHAGGDRGPRLGRVLLPAGPKR
jgi:hypothetical protein